MRAGSGPTAEQRDEKRKTNKSFAINIEKAITCMYPNWFERSECVCVCEFCTAVTVFVSTACYRLSLSRSMNILRLNYKTITVFT